jgi:UDP-hydrolysing UDP-N-acetyl-D-glucosamine 2-epimerase
MRVTCVISARPSYGRIKTALTALRARGVDVSVVCVASALLQKYGAIADQIVADGFAVTWTSYSRVDGDHGAASARTMGLTTLDLASLFQHTQPHVVVAIADRHEVLATAVAASYQNLPLAHVQGGETSGSIDNRVRNAVTALADLHLVSNVEAQHRVMHMRPNGPVLVTGCPSIDLAKQVDDTPLLTLPGIGDRVDLLKPFVLVLQHPVTDEAGEAAEQIRQTEIAIDRTPLPCVWFWPGADSGGEAASKQIRQWRPARATHFVRQVPPDDFIRLMRQCSVFIGNSSAGIREGSALGVPVVNIGSRQQGRTRAENVIDVPPESEAIQAAMQRWLRSGRPTPVNIYGDGFAGKRMAEAIVNWGRSRKDQDRNVETWRGPSVA